MPQTPPDGTAFPWDATSRESQKDPGDLRHPPGRRDLRAIAGELPPVAQLSHLGLLGSSCPTDLSVPQICGAYADDWLENSLEKQLSLKSLVLWLSSSS